MAKSFNEKLAGLLKTDARFVDDEGELVKAAVIDRAWKIDRELVKLLLGKPEIKKIFFDEIEKHWIFNINTFIEYISDKNFLANSYTRFRNRIGLTIDGKFLRERGEVSLVWPYKDCVLEGGQTKEEEKRKEIFFNEILAQDEIDRLFDPKVLANFKRYTAEGKKKVTEIKRDDNGTIKENLIIKGNNLLALHTLKKQFRGKVKLIYIDPPYNTGSDSFNYNDSFNHSTWLTFIKNRLEIAKELLRNDGVIFISTDDNEHAYLKIICDEVFGRDNFISDIIIQSNKGGRDYLEIAKTHEYVVVYSKSSQVKLYEMNKNEDAFKYQDVTGKFNIRELRNRNPRFNRSNRPNLFYPVFVNKNKKDKDGFCAVSLKKTKEYRLEVLPKDSFGIDDCWRWGKNLVEKNIDPANTEINNVVAKQRRDGGWNIYEKHRKTTQKVKSIWDDTSVRTESGTIELGKVLGKNLFHHPKPVELIKRVLRISTKSNDIIVDFFSGSATTAQAVLELNQEDSGKRRFILIEQLEGHIKVCKQRMQNIIKNNQNENKGDLFKERNDNENFIYCELMEYNEAFMDKIQAAKTSKELEKIWKYIAENSFLNWYVNPEIPEEAVKDFREIGRGENGLEKQKKLLAELLNKNQLYVNLSEIDDTDFKVSEADKKLNREFYGEGV